MKNVPVYYENSDDNDQRAIEEAIIQYMDVYSKVLIELSSMIPVCGKSGLMKLKMQKCGLKEACSHTHETSWCKLWNHEE